MFQIYWIISENKKRTYVGFSNNVKNRVKQHSSGQVRTTKSYGKFKIYILGNVKTLKDARIKERYWKSSAGRRQLKKYFEIL